MNLKKSSRVAALTLAFTVALAPAARAMSVEDVRDILREYYIDPIPEEILALPTIDEITTALGDPYTYYMSGEEYDELKSDLSDASGVGIGVTVKARAEGLYVTDVAPGSPAERGDIRKGDWIVGADGTSAEEADSPDALLELIAGEAGSAVELTVRRGEETFSLTLIREEVVYPLVTSEVVDGHIGWLDVNSFGDTTGDYVRDYLLEENEDADRWVFDMRENGGGYADAAIETLGYVLGNRDMAYIVDRQQYIETWRPDPSPFEYTGIIVDEPVVVLVDGETASAAELFAAAVRDYGAGIIIGVKTFGKGVAQSSFEDYDGSALKATTHRYYSPNFVTPDHSGVFPHLVVHPDLADKVARLLCGKPGGMDLLTVTLAGRDFYVHRDQAASGDYAAAFAELLSALPPDAVLTLDGERVTPGEAALAWETDYVSRFFDDVAGSPYETEINTLAALGMVYGNEEGNFKPEGELTRAELASLLTQALGLWCWNFQGRAPFPDVEDGDWFADSADILYFLGLMEGDEAGNFNPNDLIDHQQFLTVLMRAGAWVDFNIKRHLEGLDPMALEVPDAAAFSLWARPYAVVAGNLSSERFVRPDGVLTQPLAELDPAAVTTRGEACSMLYALMAYSGLLTPAVK